MKTSNRFAQAPLDPIIALSVLEAVRSCDGLPARSSQETTAPGEEIKLGRTQIVATQIERYAVLARKEGDLQAHELGALFTLVDRRPDADVIFADAGRRAGRHAASRTSLLLRLLHRSLPRSWREKIGRRLVRQAAAKVFDIDVVAGCTSASTISECAASSSQGGRACGLYGSGLAELLRCFTSFDGACFLTTCRVRGDGTCRWSTLKEKED